MRDDHIWNRAKEVDLRIGPEITGGFSVGFDRGIPEETKNILMDFVYWVEDRFPVPVTLWVDFKHKHYLLRDGKRTQYRFYWADFSTYPVFENPDDIPVIELAVKTERQNIRQILKSFAKAITKYYLWLTNGQITEPDDNGAEEILQAYLQKETATHKMKLNPGPYGLIASGRKTIELRLNDPKRQAIRVEDLLEFTNTETGEKILTRVVALHRFADFAALYDSLPLEKCGYLPEELATASPKDMEAYYTHAQQTQYGVLGIEIETL